MPELQQIGSKTQTKYVVIVFLNYCIFLVLPLP